MRKRDSQGGRLAFPVIEDRAPRDNTVTLLSLAASPDSVSDWSDANTWAQENTEDPYTDAQLAEMQAMATSVPTYLGELYWKKRVATRTAQVPIEV